MTPFIDRKRHELAASRKIVQCPEKIFGKNEEEMFAYRKAL
jgi:hypothetical protein